MRSLLLQDPSLATSVYEGWTLLRYAVQEGHKAVVGLLFHNGANTETQLKGQTALSCAAIKGHNS